METKQDALFNNFAEKAEKLEQEMFADDNQMLTMTDVIQIPSEQIDTHKTSAREYKETQDIK